MKGVRTTTNKPRLPQDMLNMVKALRRRDRETHNISLNVWQFSTGDVETEYCHWDGVTSHVFKTWQGLVRHVEEVIK